MLKEFKEFALKGNVLDLAIGIVIGSAFGKIVTSVVNDLLMPPLGLLIRRVDFKELFLNLSGTSYATLNDAKVAGAPTLNYGLFVNTVIEFLLIAFALAPAGLRWAGPSSIVHEQACKSAPGAPSKKPPEASFSGLAVLT